MEAMIYVVIACLAGAFCPRVNWKGKLILAAVTALVGVGLYFGTIYLKSSSYEFIAGHITGKNWAYDPETYSCGKDNKDTCTRARWRWTVESNVGDVVEYTYSPSSPDWYDAAKKGGPFAKTKRFTNGQYLAENSVLFEHSSYKGWLPEYPSIYSAYRVDRCISNMMDCSEMSRILEVAQIDWGPTHKVNVMVVAVADSAKEFDLALRRHWYGGKKNDAVVVLYLDKEFKITDVGVFSRSTGTLSDSQGRNFNTALKESVLAVGQYNGQNLMKAIAPNLRYFDREDLSKHDFWFQTFQLSWYWIAGHIVALIALFVGIWMVLKDAYGYSDRSWADHARANIRRATRFNNF